MKEKQNAALGTAPLGRLMLKFALPCTVSLLVGALYNIVDQIFIGWGVGYLGNGATNVVFPLTVLALGLAVMIGDGACSYVSICFGRNEPENANRAVGSAVTLSVLVGIADRGALCRVPDAAFDAVRRDGGEFRLCEGIFHLHHHRHSHLCLRTGDQPHHPLGRQPAVRHALHAGGCGRELHSGPDRDFCSALGRDGRSRRNGGRAGHHGGNGRMVPVPHKGAAPESGRF